jgi:hypothetical protein
MCDCVCLWRRWAAGTTVALMRTGSETTWPYKYGYSYARVNHNLGVEA